MSKLKSKSKSHILTSCLIAASFAIVNCQKAPSRTAVKPNVVAPTGTPEKPIEVQGVDQCDAPTIKILNDILRKNAKEVEELNSKDKTADEKKAIQAKRSSYLDSCVTAITAIAKQKNAACLEETDKAKVKDAKKNDVTAAELDKSCSKALVALKADGGEHSYDFDKMLKDAGQKVETAEEKKAREAKAAEEKKAADAAKRANETPEQKKARETKEQSAATDIIKKNGVNIDVYSKANLEIGSDLKKLAMDANSDFAKVLINGNLKEGKETVEATATANEVMCSVAKKGSNVSENDKSLIMKVSTVVDGTSSDLGLVSEAYKGKEILKIALLQVNDGSKSDSETYSSTMTIVCINISMKTEGLIGKLKKALGESTNVKEISAEKLKTLIVQNKTTREAAAKPAAAAAPVQALAASAPATVSGSPAVIKLTGEIAAQTLIVESANAKVVEATKEVAAIAKQIAESKTQPLATNSGSFPSMNRIEALNAKLTAAEASEASTKTAAEVEKGKLEAMKAELVKLNAAPVAAPAAAASTTAIPGTGAQPF